MNNGRGTTRIIPVGQVSAEQLEALKVQHKNVLIIKLRVSKTEVEEPVEEGSDKKHTVTVIEESYGYLRKYKRQHVERAFAISATEGMLAAGRYMLEQLWIEGIGDTRQISQDDEDVDIAISAQNEAGSYIKFLPGEIKNY